MKRIIISFLLVLFSSGCICQVAFLKEFNKERVQITKHSMLVIAAWGGANLLYNGIAAGSAGGRNQYFYRMNLIWGSVNFSLGTLGFLFTKNNTHNGYAQTLNKQQAVEKIYLFNTGLDVAYVVGGFYFKERANNSVQKHDRFKGYGKSFIMQGSALFIYDGIMYFIHHGHGKSIGHFADSFQAGFTLNGLYCALIF